jgi:drug/metabolite transporter (DMT)-like permease
VGSSDERRGLFCAALCALNGALVPALTKLTSGRGDPVVVATVTTLFAAAGALVVSAARGELRALRARERRGALVALGAIGTTLAYVCLFLGTRRASAIEVALCLQIEPAYALLGAWAVLGHRLTRRRVAATTVVLAGIALAIGARGFSSPVGVVLLLATPLCWQVSHLLVLRRLAGVPPALLTAARFVYGGALLAMLVGGGLLAGSLVRRPGMPASASATLADPAAAPGTPAGDAPLPRADDLALLALQGFVVFYLGTMLWYAAIARLDLARTTAIVVPSIPLLSLGASFVLLGEVPTARQLAGMALTIAGVYAFVTAPHAVDVRVRITAPSVPIAAEAAPD